MGFLVSPRLDRCVRTDWDPDTNTCLLCTLPNGLSFAVPSEILPTWNLRETISLYLLNRLLPSEWPISTNSGWNRLVDEPVVRCVRVLVGLLQSDFLLLRLCSLRYVVFLLSKVVNSGPSNDLFFISLYIFEVLLLTLLKDPFFVRRSQQCYLCIW